MNTIFQSIVVRHMKKIIVVIAILSTVLSAKAQDALQIGSGDGTGTIIDATGTTGTYTLPGGSGEVLTLGVTAKTSGNLIIANGTTQFNSVALSGDATILNTGVLTISKINGVSLDASVLTPSNGSILIYNSSSTKWEAHALTTSLSVNAATGAVSLTDGVISLAKLVNASNSSRLLGSGSSGSGSAYTELIVGSGLSLSTTTLSVPVMVASGASHAAGLVPDPGVTAGTTKFLREDGTWQVPAGGSSGINNQTTQQTSANFNIDGTGIAATFAGNGGTSGTALTVRGGNATSGTGGALNLNGGVSTGANTGGAVSIAAAQGGATGVGGAVSITSGAGGTTSGTAGALSISTGASANGSGGAMTIAAGGSSLGNGGTLSISSGTSSSSGNGGALTITGGSGASNTSSDGGAVTITAGGGGNGGGGNAGIATLKGGTGNGAAAGGTARLIGGDGPTAGGALVSGGAATGGGGGGVTITGTSAVVAGSGGGVSISTGNSISGNGGAFSLTTGNASTTASGGAISMTVGTSTGADGGGISLTAGDGNGGTNSGGSITLTPGVAAGAGTNGFVAIAAGKQLRFNEPSGAEYSSFQAASQSANFNYTLPTTIPTANQVLTATSVSAPNVTLGWSTVSAGSSSFADNAFRITDDGDVTKRASFQASGITTASTRTYTFPDTSGSLTLGTGTANTVPKFVTANIVGNSTITDDASTVATTVDLKVNGANKKLIFLENDGGSSVSSFKAGAQSADINYTLPTAAPTVDGQVLSSTTGGTMSWATPTLIKVKTATQAVTNNATPQNDNTLSLTLGVGTWLVRGLLTMDVAGTGGVNGTDAKVDFAFSGTSTDFAIGYSNNGGKGASNNTNDGPSAGTFTALATSVTFGIDANKTIGIVYEGYITVSVSGTFQVRFSNGTAAANADTEMLKGSTLQATKQL